MAEAEDYKTSSAKAFREHYDKLVDMIQEPDLPVLGARFFSRQIISRETVEMVGNLATSRAVRASKLILAVMAHLDIHPDKFESALDVFREEHVYTQLSSLVTESHGKDPQSPESQTTVVAPSTTPVGKHNERITADQLAEELDIDCVLLDGEFPSTLKARFKFAKFIPNWLSFAKVLGLSSQEIQTIDSDLDLTHAGMRERNVLEKWKAKNGFNATYRRLIEACLKMNEREVAVNMCRAISIDESDVNANQLAQDLFIEASLLDEEFPNNTPEIHFELAKFIPNWLLYAEALALSRQEIQEIRSNRDLAGTGMRERTVLKKWKANNGFKATYRKLIEVCLLIGERGVAEGMCKAIGSISQGSQTPDTQATAITPPTTAVGKYAAYLRKVYLRSKLPVKGKWPPSPCKKIIKLAAIEKKEPTSQVEKLSRFKSVDEYMLKNSMSPISMDDLLLTKDGSRPKAVVVQGVPGIGKSTFAWKFCRRWAKGKIYQQYYLVVLLRMRDTRVREAKELSDLFYPLSKHEQQQLAKEMFACSGKGVILLFEGLDELPSTLLGEDSIFLEILQGLSLPEVTIVVTTRPWAVQAFIRNCGDQISRQVEILGFTQDDILRYVSNAFSEEEKGEFLEYLRSHPQLESIMHIPLNAAFVVQIYKQFKRSQQAIPNTLTQLYTALVKGLLLRYMESVPELSCLKLVELQSLPEPIKTHFQQLCLLAFMSFTKLTVQVTFTDSEAALYRCLDSLGLMQSSADLSIDTGTTVTHSFLHFTIQEFLAAYHLSQQPAQVQELFLETHNRDQQFSVLLGFLIGLNSKVLESIGLSNEEDTVIINSTTLHWLYESQSPEGVSKYLGNGVVRYDPSEQTPYDLYALTYCICHSNCKWEITIMLRHLTSVFSSSASDCSLCSGPISVLDAVDGGLFQIQAFFSLPQRMFSKLSDLFFSGTQSSAYLALAEVIRGGLLPCLKKLRLYYPDNIKDTNIGTVVDVLQESCVHLTEVAVMEGSFTSSDILPLCRYVSSPTQLSMLLLWLNTFLEDSLQLLISAVACAKSLSYLDLSSLELSLSDMEMLSVALSTNSSLKGLKISNISIDEEGAELLATGLEDNQTLVELTLYFNSIDANGAAALSSILTVNNSLRKLDLRENESIGTEGAIRLINALEQNRSLQTLILSTLCEPIEFGSILMRDVRESNRVLFSDCNPFTMHFNLNQSNITQ